MPDPRVRVKIETDSTKARSELGKFNTVVGKVRTGIQNTIKTVAALSVAVVGLGSHVIKAAGEFEQWEIAFETLTGSANNAKALLDDIAAFAAKTPFDLPSLIEGSKRLLAYNIEAEKIIPTMETLGNITAGVGTEKMNQLILAFGQVRAATILTGQELRQFTEAGVPLISALADHFGVAESEIKNMVSNSMVGFEDVESALNSLASGSGKFADLMVKQSKSFLGIVSNTKDNITQLSIEIGKVLLPEAKRGAQALEEFTDISRVRQFTLAFNRAFIAIRTGIFAML
jgi:tape measure domain-containing protein